ncbi:MAG: DUF3467 domain-containing protein [bacterium]|jgi:hypothetical protein|nr:DUF3467 domain-containing protein [bacterium]|tara:strand:- start:379 stop:705 length:327 start_codon:yes stop_codon:yes gene_type:complete
MAQKPITFDLAVDHAIATGVYSNIQGISFSETEVILDFARVIPQSNKGKVVSRVILHPRNAKYFFRNLKRSLENYEKAHGEIKIQDGEPKNIGFRSDITASPSAEETD